MSKYFWNSHDIKIIFGDLNFRNVGMHSREQIIKLIG